MFIHTLTIAVAIALIVAVSFVWHYHLTKHKNGDHTPAPWMRMTVFTIIVLAFLVFTVMTFPWERLSGTV